MFCVSDDRTDSHCFHVSLILTPLITVLWLTHGSFMDSAKAQLPLYVKSHTHR